MHKKSWDDMGMKNYSQRIRELREDHDKAQREIAAVLGTTQQVYSRYESGENEMPIRHLITLARFYHVSTDYILGLSDNPGRIETDSSGSAVNL
jgi:transcriptional regulator with XRE-family HTH domain